MSNKTRKRRVKITPMSTSKRMKRKSKRMIHRTKGGASYLENENLSDLSNSDSEPSLSRKKDEYTLSRKIDDSRVIEDILSPEKPGTPAEVSPANYYKRDDGFYAYLSLPRNKGIKFEELSDKDRAIEYMHYLEFNPLVIHPIGIPNGKLYEIIIAYRYEYEEKDNLNFLIDYADTNFLLKLLNDQSATYIPNGISKMWKYIGRRGNIGRKLFNKLLFLQYKNGILLSKGLCYFPPAKNDITVYRGMRGTTPVPKTNEPVIYLMSTSPKKNVAIFFAGNFKGKKGKVLNITIPKGFPFSYVSGYEPEAEILLGYESTFVIGPKIMNDGVIHDEYNLTLTGMKETSKELEKLEEAKMMKKIEEFKDFEGLFQKRLDDGINTNNDNSRYNYNINIFTIKRHMDDNDFDLIEAFFELQNKMDREAAEGLFGRFKRYLKKFKLFNKTE